MSNAIDALEQAEAAVKVWEPWGRSKDLPPAQKVSRLGSSYICKQTNAGIDPSVDTADGGGVEGAYWLLIAKKGRPGRPGCYRAAGVNRQAGHPGRAGPDWRARRPGHPGTQRLAGHPGRDRATRRRWSARSSGHQGRRGRAASTGVAVQTSGMVTFNVSEDGHLLCSYTGDQRPNYYINLEGHLCLDI